MLLYKSIILSLVYTIPIFANISLRKIELSINNHTFLVELADTPESRAQGLMFRQHLGSKEGMLFVFPDQDYRSFYMKNTFIPLSIAYIDIDGTILEIYDMTPFSQRSVQSRNNNIAFALELNQGSFEQFGIKPGMKIRNLPIASQR
ncbi:DUF192 domain-containing protein [Entomospira nematocerorum]|uniref:DUF192 domain-containing protein n=1 Tax=Entomospira nematocerorum TaxID=2719987 RepID=A0A968KU76_9SPIO|nr:DUF192 domain-containing protein [Entomospira nematocera]NIZ46969.1 DUF192 domain-containing protein [Entomospira nematocera]WDI34485.1 DUF192 domain-containing protein [Entomospira nematocera]